MIFQYLPMFTFCNGYFYTSTTIFSLILISNENRDLFLETKLEAKLTCLSKISNKVRPNLP